MLITDSIVSKPIKRDNGTCATLKTALPYATVEKCDGRHGARNEKKLNGFMSELSSRIEKKAQRGTCEHYMLNCKVMYIDSEYISMFFEAYGRSRGKTVSYTPFSATYRFDRSRFCRACEFCKKDDIKNAAKHLPSADIKYSFYLSDGCITFFEKRANTNRIAKLSIPIL